LFRVLFFLCVHTIRKIVIWQSVRWLLGATRHHFKVQSGVKYPLSLSLTQLMHWDPPRVPHPAGHIQNLPQVAPVSPLSLPFISFQIVFYISIGLGFIFRMLRQLRLPDPGPQSKSQLESEETWLKRLRVNGVISTTAGWYPKKSSVCVMSFGLELWLVTEA